MSEQDIINKTVEISDEYPIEATYSSKSRLWWIGLNKDLLTIDMYKEAREYYGYLWTYVGD